MSNWRVLYRDQLDQDRTSDGIPSKEAALRKARELYYNKRAAIYGIEGPDGRALPKKEVSDWVSEHRW